ncbi:MAG TPA: response regulator, partial [Bacteroidales bacterium]
ILTIRSIALEILKLRNKIVIEHKLTDLKIKFFTNISHELRTPLTLIMGPTDELLKHKPLEDETKDYIEIIDKNAKRMLRHINQLLDFRKIETGKMRLSISETEIVSFVKDIYDGFRELAASKKIEYKFTSNAKKLNGWIDHDKMDTAIFNLLSNAFKFTPENKTIEVIVNDVKNTEFFEIVVKDTGVGISPEDMPYLFERFAISHKSADFRTKGTGIGLSLVKEIISLHVGNIMVDSAPGKGSTFIIRLSKGKSHFMASEVEFDTQNNNTIIHSFAQSELTNAPFTTDAKPEIKKEAPVILVVEDNLDLRSYLLKKLTDYYNVEEAVDGLDGWDKAQTVVPDLIISDIMMPKMDGIELTDKLRNDFKTSHIPIILLTAKSSVENMIEGLKYGADAYITKPFSMEYLKVSITNLLDQRKRLIEKFDNKYKTIDLSPDEIIVTSKDEVFLKDVIRIIEENMVNTDFNVEMIASTVGLGRTSFFKKLKGLTNMAPVEFMREMRVKRGHQLLQSGNFTVSEVAFQIGFNDAGYFSKCFKEKYNITPTDFLKTIKN